jgi:hypothetical protein
MWAAAQQTVNEKKGQMGAHNSAWVVLIMSLQRGAIVEGSCYRNALPPARCAEDEDDDHGITHDSCVDDAVPPNGPHVAAVGGRQDASNRAEHTAALQPALLDEVARRLHDDLKRRKQVEEARKVVGRRHICGPVVVINSGERRTPCQLGPSEGRLENNVDGECQREERMHQAPDPRR